MRDYLTIVSSTRECDLLDDRLRATYENVLSEPLPDSLAHLVEALRRRGGDERNDDERSGAERPRVRAAGAIARHAPSC